MQSRGWLYDELEVNSWAGSNTCWQKDATYNLWLVDNALVATDDLYCTFRGTLQCPEGQMMSCCVDAGGEPHMCSKRITHAADQLVEWRIPIQGLSGASPESFVNIALQNVQYTGCRIYSTTFDETTGKFIATDADGNSFHETLHVGSTNDALFRPHLPEAMPAQDGVSSCRTGDSTLGGFHGQDPSNKLCGDMLVRENPGGRTVGSQPGDDSNLFRPCPTHQVSGSVSSTPVDSHFFMPRSSSGVSSVKGQTAQLVGAPKGKWGLGELAPMQRKVLQFVLDPQFSHAYPKGNDRDASNDWSMVELFSGAFAGWKQGVDAMTQLGVPWVSTHAVEIDSQVAHLYCKSFGIDCIFHEDDPKLAMPFPLHKQSELGCTMYRGDVQNPEWIKTVPWGNKIAACISAPCPPWSRASSKDGLHHPDGRLLIGSAIAMRFLQPMVAIFENVDTIKDHRHFKCLRDVMLWAGYQLAWESIADLRKVAPIARKRWLAVFVKTTHDIHQVLSTDFLEMPQPTLESHKILMQLPSEHENDLTLDDELLRVYSDVRYAPKSIRMSFFREQGTLNDEQMLKLRIKHGRVVLSTFLASYSSQHELPEHCLLDKGLFAELTCGKTGAARFFSPFEIASAHGLVTSLCLPKNTKVAHMVVGNAISTQHAILAMTHARNLADTSVSRSPHEMVLRAMLNRFHADNSVIVDEDEYLWILPRNASVAATQIDPETPSPLSVISENPMVEADDEASEVVVSPTMQFLAGYQIKCLFPDSLEVFMTQGDESLSQLLTRNNRSYAIDFFALDADKCHVRPDMILQRDMEIQFKNADQVEIDLVLRRATWKVFKPRFSPYVEVKKMRDDLKMPGLMGYDVACNPIRENTINDVNQLILLTVEPINFEDVWSCQLMHPYHPQKVQSEIRVLVPQMRLKDDHIAIVDSVEPHISSQREMFQHVATAMMPVVNATKWTWRVEEGRKIGRYVPSDDDAAPVSAVHLALLRCVIDGILSAYQQPNGILVRLKLNGCTIWERSLPRGMRLDLLHAIMQCILFTCGGGNVTWIWGGRYLSMDERAVDELQDEDKMLRLNMISRSRGGGGAKDDAWKGVKNQLAKLLIQKGWSLVGLDEITSEWVDKIGLSQLQNIFKTQLSLDRKWHTLIDYAKMRNLKVQPDDPVKMRAARTIQQALRKNKTFDLVASRFTLAEGFFLKDDDSAVPLIDHVDLKTSGVCLLDWEQAIPWLTKTLPIVQDELAILTLAGKDIPDGYPRRDETTFPAVDDKRRPVVLRGCLWQLGGKKVKWVTHDDKVQPAPTLVVACTVWRDEVTEERWKELGKSLVKTTLSMLTGIDTKTQVLQVWGRSYRDERSRVDPAYALSAQFHCRVFMDQAETILLESGRNAVYLTPKSENHLSHPSWAMLWFEDRVAVDIAASKASEHSGIARVKNKYALRVRASMLAQVSKEVKPAGSSNGHLQILHLYKIQPIPLGIKQEQLVEWAGNLKWNVRVVKKLGKDAYLLGTNEKPPQPHMSLNGTVVLIKQVVAKKLQKDDSALVAGPRQLPLKDMQKDHATTQEPIDDAWARYRAQNGSAFQNGAQVLGKANTPQSLPQDGQVAQKFAAMEQRIQQQDQEIQKLSHDCQQVVQAVTATSSQMTVVEQRVGGLETHTAALQNDVKTSVETAISRGLASQDKKLDQKFETLMGMLSAVGAKRKVPEEDEDAQMESPQKSN